MNTLNPGDLVDVFWDKKPDSLDLKGRVWRNQKVVSLCEFRDGKMMVFLEGRPCCPVRIERVKKQTSP